MGNKRIFISFTIEDKFLRDSLVGQARNERSPFEFVDMSVKKPWSSQWKTHCRTKIKGCDGVLIIVTKNSKNASGQLWEVACANQERIPQRGIWGYSDDRPTYLPTEFDGIRVVYWTWNNINNWLNTL